MASLPKFEHVDDIPRPAVGTVTMVLMRMSSGNYRMFIFTEDRKLTLVGATADEVEAMEMVNANR